MLRRADFATFKSKRVPCNYANFRVAFQVGETNLGTGAFLGRISNRDTTLGAVAWQGARQPLWSGRIISIRFAGDIISTQIVGSNCRRSHDILW